MANNAKVQEINLPKEIANITQQLNIINQQLENNENIWVRKYNSFTKFNTINNQIQQIQYQLKYTKPTAKNNEKIQNLSNKLEVLQKQQKLFKDYDSNPYKELTEVKEIQEVPNITNPIAIFSGLSFLKHIKSQEKTLRANQQSLNETIALLNHKKELLSQLLKLQTQIHNKQGEDEVIRELQKNHNIKIELETTQSILETSIEVFSRRVADLDLRLSNQIQSQTLKTIYIIVSCLIVFSIAFAFKIALRKYLDEERIYIANKIISFVYISIIVIIILLSYLNNITYLVTFLGFISAGLAFAMRDLFMSTLGWLVIVIGGGLHVGDRIRIHRDNTTYIGDILDISMTRIALLEDVTYNTYAETRRAGRIVFIPNNFIFNTVISNYTHSGMTTIWDGIDFTITFDSNYKKAVEIATEVARKHSRSHIEIGKRKMLRLKEKYSIKRISLEPRIFNMLEPNGMKISVWYQTNAFTTLNVRSSISGDIVDAIGKEHDIKIAYPTTKIVNTGSDGAWERYSEAENVKSVF
ncbi:hypothetical protein BBW65_00575 [Helicobacter enhydrae]|uniref:Mechanosensitive ion channel n=1 Tax=Helicobacter enhydrae TaxID=222136 RepID=A0A1B1U7H9_9HELI|nr:hypothetical protein BBW65_00575 [Helicobacter enhydrae]